LIEVLVTVAIIALLTSILMPVIDKARGLAYQVQCQSNQRNIALAMRMYIDSFNGFLPGSPNTSGAGPRKALPETAVATNAFDYASPLLGFLNTSVPANRADRQELTRLGVFKCPANNHQAEPWTGYQAIPDAADFTTSQASSYLTCWNFLLAGDGYAGAQVAPGVYYWLYGATWTEALPRDYLPKITKIGLPARKVFLADAARYVDETGRFTYDVGYALFGAGSYSGSGAWWIDSREYGQYSPAADYSYRHDDGIAVAFYDGHCEYLKREQSHKAVYWYPKGTVLTKGSDGAGGEPSGYIVP
jgi:prepilin-type processing-associated H-X9-DG protein